MRSDTTYSPIECTIVKTTAKALLIDNQEIESWIPKSVCQESARKLDDLEAGDDAVLRIADWLIDREKLFRTNMP